MKNRFILLLFCVCFVSQSFAQKTFKVGLNVGGQYTSLRGFEYPVDNDFEIGLMFGASLEYLFTENLSIVAAFNIDKLTKKTEVTFFDNQANEAGTTTFKETYHFFNVPLVLRYRFGAKRNFFVDGGGFFNYFNKAEQDRRAPLFISFEDYNYGFVFGVGTVFNFKNNTDITLQLRNELGLSDVNKYKNTLDGDIKTNTIRLIATYNFKL